ncbi:hypothetical protein ACHAW5_008355 [Stephanodiscus triporus]|uniref:Folylpoly-gamma-glutamate synthetase n=1 Tax=Stephanodiscus triporus TaxID=2934178 RepID=A0ABD3PRC7_9STRA
MRTTATVDYKDDDDDGGYESAVAALLSPLHQATSYDAIRASSARRKNTIRDMRLYLRRLDLDLNGDFEDDDDEDDEEDDDDDDDNEDEEDDDEDDDDASVPPLIFHVAGTKGKGSTLAMIESLLRVGRGLNTGLYTSPHLVDVRERIRINGMPISRRDFGNAYWDVRRRLLEGARRKNIHGDEDGDDDDVPVLPGYFRMLTLMAMSVFCRSPESTPPRC